jgi:alkanesulfonate monooxygenase SsuD/methylene tetrahydromethanopterin reductase-like flavin-dependent oxidoreductase (luciferase family)
LEETIAIVRGVWGTEPFSCDGHTYRTRDARVTPPPLQSPSPPLLIAGSGEKTTLRQVAQYADACNFLATDLAGGVRTAADVQHKLKVLRHHCEQLGRPFDTILRTHLTGWLILAEDEVCLQAKVQAYFPDGIDQRFSGPWRGFAIAATPERAVAYYQELAEAGIQYFVVEVLDAADEETIRLLAEQVMPQVTQRAVKGMA